jgi:hypothetical protein
MKIVLGLMKEDLGAILERFFSSNVISLEIT